MRMYDIIQKKRDGLSLSKEEIQFFVEQYTCGNIPDYQASALMMATFFQGMDDRETAELTLAMASSGDELDLSCFGTLSVDKHSTGGVGDKTTLIVVPIVAALGGKVSKMSGRGLGHTGGTVDKLESIPGYNTTLSADAFRQQVEEIGVAVIGQSGNLTPADKKLYALRDVTATVDSIPLITSSIMSKKIAAGSHNIVLDVKTGSGAFMKTVDQATVLAESMVRIGNRCGRRVAALITNMDVPLGNAIGNAVEVQEAIEVLKGRQKDDLYEVCIALAAQMISLVFDCDVETASVRVVQTIEDGGAFAKMKEWIGAQGGDVRYLDDPALFPKPKYCISVEALEDGYITAMDAQSIGSVSVALGAGRKTKEDTIDHASGILLHKKTGDLVRKGDVIATLLTNDEKCIAQAKQRFYDAVIVADSFSAEKTLIFDVIS